MSYSKYEIRDICKIRSGKRLPKGHFLVEFKTDHPYIRSRDIKNGKVLSDRILFITDKTHEKISKYIVKANDVCLTIVANVGDVGFVDRNLDNANLTENAVRLTMFKNDVYPRYICLLLNTRSYKAYAELLAAGAAQSKLGIYKIERIKLSLPNFKIQMKIAAILTAYSDLIEANNKRTKVLERMAEELYKEWFVRMRFPTYKVTKFIKGVPEGWEVRSLGSFAKIIMGQSPKSKFYNMNGDGLPFNQGVGTYGYRFPRKETFCNSKGRMAEKGDVLFSVRAPVGRINIADTKMIIGRGLASMRHKEDFNSFLFYLLKEYFSYENIIGNGAIFTSVGKDELNNFKVLYPSSNLIKMFNEIASRIDVLIENLINSRTNLIHSKENLLTRLMSGKLLVDDLEIKFPKSMQEETVA